ncbi:hypothetical protein ACI8AA_01435 [Geodermatophilus sp. SYSU D01180]
MTLTAPPLPPADTAGPDHPAGTRAPLTRLLALAGRGRRRRREPARPRGWTAPWLVQVTWPYYLLLTALDGLLIAFVSVADLFFIKTTLDPLIGEAEVFSWIVALALATLSVLAPLQAGRFTRKYRATGHHRTSAIALTAVWAALGAGLFVLRWIAGDLTTTVIYEGTPTGGGDTAHHLMALVLATLHLATGATAFVSGYHFTNPEAFGLRTARFRQRRVERLLATAESRFTRLASALGARVADMSEAAQAAETAKRARRAVADHVVAMARLRIAQHLGDPSCTGGTRRPGERPGSAVRGIPEAEAGAA